MTFKLGLLGRSPSHLHRKFRAEPITSSSQAQGGAHHKLITSSGRSPSGPDGQDRLSTPHPLETDRRLPLFTGWTRRVASDQVVKALTDDDVPVLGADLIRHIVRFVATQELDTIGLFPLARPPIPACHRPSKLLDHVLKNFGHIHLINLYKILMPWRKRSILRV